MKLPLLFVAALLLALVAVPAGSTSASARSSYSYQQIDPPSGFASCTAVALNERSQVLCEATSPGVSVAFLWDQGALTLIPSPTGGSVHPYALDDAGRVVGVDISSTGTLAPFSWKDGQWTWLPVPSGFSGAEPRAISNDGSAAGEAVDVAGNRYGCLWREGVVSLLPALPGRPYSQVRGMNDHGQIVGTSFALFDPAERAHAGQGRAVMWQDGQPQDLGTVPGYSFSEGYGINNLGTMLGVSYEAPAFRQAFAGTAVALRPVGRDLVPRAIDDSGRIVGFTPDPDEAVELRRGWSESLVWSLPWGDWPALTDAPALNERGQIAASGLRQGARRAFLLSPAPADLEARVSVSSDTVAIGDTITATITVTNRGPAPARFPRVGYYAADGAQIVSASVTGWELRWYPELAIANAAQLAPGASVVLTVRLQCAIPGDIKIRADSYAENDCALGNNSTLATVLVPGTPLPDLAVAMWDPGYFRWGGSPEWPEIVISTELHVVNHGTADCSGFNVGLYLVEPGGPFRRRLLVKTMRFRRLERGDDVTWLVYGRARVRSLEGLLLEAEVDPGNRVREGVETNNLDRTDLAEFE